MATSVSQTKESRTRLARILLVVSNVFPEVMQELLLNIIPPRTLFSMIKNDKNLNGNLNSKEQQIVQDMYQRGFTDVDVTFAYKLLKYFNLIPTPTQKWGREPRPFDVSISDDLERIHHFRNNIFHRSSTEVSEADFQKYFTDLIEIGQRLDTFLQKNPTFGFSKKILLLQTNSIDAETEEKYTNALEEICELKLQLRHIMKSSKKLNIYYAPDFESMLQETNEDTDEVAATIVIHGCENTEAIIEKINNLKERLNTGRYTIKLNKASHGCVLLFISIRTKKLKHRRIFLAKVTKFIEDIFVISKVDCDVTAVLRLFDVILDKDDFTRSSTRQYEWPSTYYTQPGDQKKSIQLDVGIKTKILESSTCLQENVIGFLTDVLETENENEHTIDVILQGERTGLQVIKALRDVELVKGETLHLSCKLNRDLNIKWLKNGREISCDKQTDCKKTSQENLFKYTLKMKNIKMINSGEYSCVCGNFKTSCFVIITDIPIEQIINARTTEKLYEIQGKKEELAQKEEEIVKEETKLLEMETEIKNIEMEIKEKAEEIEIQRSKLALKEKEMKERESQLELKEAKFCEQEMEKMMLKKYSLTLTQQSEELEFTRANANMIENELKKIKHENTELEKRIEILEKYIENGSVKHKQKIAEIRQTYDNMITNMKAEHDDTLSTIDKRFEDMQRKPSGICVVS